MCVWCDVCGAVWGGGASQVSPCPIVCLCVSLCVCVLESPLHVLLGSSIYAYHRYVCTCIRLSVYLALLISAHSHAHVHVHAQV